VDGVVTASPDPVMQAAAYQQHLLGLLRQDDPAEVQASTHAALLEILEDTGSDLGTKPAPGEWSVLELLGHLVDAEIVLSGRYRWVLSHDRPPLLGYDQDRWVERLRHNDDPPDELLEVFSTLRTANLRMWYRSSADDRQRMAVHAERGPESYELMFRMLAGHDRFHLDQMRRTLATIRAAR
jgi:DinB superfamily